ncbi:MAG: peptide deformylase, partial [Pseudomonadota bacterium]
QVLVDNMFATMYEAKGIGLAATQVNVHEQLVVMDISEDRNEPRVFINPKITAQKGEATGEEGCLSVPGTYEEVKRFAEITLESVNVKGEKQILHADGLLAVCIQHELDHLKGKVFVEYLSSLKQNRIRGKQQKRARELSRTR